MFWLSQMHSYNAALTLALSVFQEPDCRDRVERQQLASLICSDLENLVLGGHANAGLEGAKILRHFVTKLESVHSPASLNAELRGQQQTMMDGSMGGSNGQNLGFTLMEEPLVSTVGFEGEIWDLLINNWLRENPLMKEAHDYQSTY